MGNARLNAGLGVALILCGLAGSWWVLSQALWFLDPGQEMPFGAGAVALGLFVWLVPASPVLACLFWWASRRRSGWSRPMFIAVASGFALAAALDLGLTAYSLLFNFGTLQFAPIAPDLELLSWVLPSPALVGGLWLLAEAMRSQRPAL